MWDNLFINKLYTCPGANAGITSYGQVKNGSSSSMCFLDHLIFKSCYHSCKQINRRNKRIQMVSVTFPILFYIRQTIQNYMEEQNSYLGTEEVPLFAPTSDEKTMAL